MSDYNNTKMVLSGRFDRPKFFFDTDTAWTRGKLDVDKPGAVRRTC